MVAGARVLDMHDLGAEIGHQLAAQGGGDNGGAFDHPEAPERGQGIVGHGGG